MAMNPKHDTSTDADLRTRAEQYLTYQSSTEDLIRFLLAEVAEAERRAFAAGWQAGKTHEYYYSTTADEGELDAAFLAYQHSRQG